MSTSRARPFRPTAKGTGKKRSTTPSPAPPRSTTGTQRSCGRCRAGRVRIRLGARPKAREKPGMTTEGRWPRIFTSTWTTGSPRDDYRCFFADEEGSSYFREDGTRCRDENGRLLWPCRHQDRIWSMPDILAGRSPWPFAGHLPETVEELLQSPDPVGALVETFPPADGCRFPSPRKGPSGRSGRSRSPKATRPGTGSSRPRRDGLRSPGSSRPTWARARS